MATTATAAVNGKAIQSLTARIIFKTLFSEPEMNERTVKASCSAAEKETLASDERRSSVRVPVRRQAAGVLET
jgi:hypothetical protein